MALAATDIGLVGHKQPYWYTMAGPAHWGSMSLTVEDLASISVAMTGRDLSLPRDGLTMTTTAACHAKLLRLHAAAGHLAEHAPDIITIPKPRAGSNRL